MNKKLLKVLERLDMGNETSLVCEVPEHLLRNLHRDESGEVDLAGLLTLCKAIATEEPEETLAEVSLDIASEEEFQHKLFWFRMIFDRSLAVDPLAVKG